MAVAARDYYEELGVARDASTSEIRKAYRALARKHHPDVSSDPDAAARFAAIAEAYEVLRDKKRRASYDRPDHAGGAAAGAPHRGRAAQPAEGGFAESQFGDLFSQIFGDRARPNGYAGFASAGADQEAVLDLTLEEAVPGGRHRFSLADGRDFDGKVPPGVRDGQRIRLAGEGLSGAGGGPPGDLFLHVHLMPHPRYRRDGLDLSVDVPVTPWEAALGVRADVPTLGGTAKVRIPGGSPSGGPGRHRRQPKTG